MRTSREEVPVHVHSYLDHLSEELLARTGTDLRQAAVRICPGCHRRVDNTRSYQVLIHTLSRHVHREILTALMPPETQHTIQWLANVFDVMATYPLGIRKVTKLRTLFVSYAKALHTEGPLI